MRGTVDGLASPHPIGGLAACVSAGRRLRCPTDHGFRRSAGAPLLGFDCLDAYVDPLLAPDDFVPWLGAWVGTTAYDRSVDRRAREGILASTPMHRLRGTAEGLRAQLTLATGGEVEVEETGEFQCSTSPTEDHDQPDPGTSSEFASTTWIRSACASWRS